MYDLRLVLLSAPAVCGAGYQWDYVFDWTILKYQQLQQNARPSDAGAGGARPRDESAGATFPRATARCPAQPPRTGLRLSCQSVHWWLLPCVPHVPLATSERTYHPHAGG
jgi:hypothetical protein